MMDHPEPVRDPAGHEIKEAAVKPFTFVLCTETKLVTPADLFRMQWPLEQNAQHCAEAWGLPAPAIEVAEDRGKLPEYCRPIVFVDNEGDPGVLAVHYWDPVRNGPAGRVYVDHGTGLRTGPYSATESAAHEILEALVDPGCDQWRPHPTLRTPDGEVVEVALEVGDPRQDTYEILHWGQSWPVANYVTPAWFDPALVDEEARLDFIHRGGSFDRLKRTERPGELGPEGYMVVRARSGKDWRYWQEWGARKLTHAGRSMALDHAWSRTKHRLAGCPQIARPRA